MKTIGECVGGPMDGVQLDSPDEDEPDDWPDQITVGDKKTGSVCTYYIDSKQLRTGKPTVRGKYRIWRFLHEDLLESREDEP